MSQRTILELRFTEAFERENANTANRLSVKPELSSPMEDIMLVNSQAISVPLPVVRSKQAPIKSKVAKSKKPASRKPAKNKPKNDKQVRSINNNGLTGLPQPSGKFKSSPSNHDGIDLSVYRDGLGKKKSNLQPAKPINPYELTLTANPILCWHSGDSLPGSAMLKYGRNGLPVEAAEDLSGKPGRELMLGIDFGTSSAKVVIGDPSLKQAFAVPFFETTGIARFLLPSHIFQSSEGFCLVRGENIYRDLKLALIYAPDNLQCHYRVVAFLAFVIRHARAWLLEKYAAIYKGSQLFWRMAIGLPAATHHNSRLKSLFELLARAAWLVSHQPGEVFSLAVLKQALSRADKLKSGLIPQAHEDLELVVIPEIAAQIYGYVSSDNFDKHAQNIFLLVDVGAGTVDTSLFHIKKTKAKWDFEFFTSSVKPNGTMNLNRYRLNWWQDALRQVSPRPDVLIQEIDSTKEATDSQRPLPDNIVGYISGAKLSFNDEKANPDWQFFSRRLSSQVKLETFIRAWKEGHLNQADLKGIPAYLCGGGMRLPFYKKLAVTLQSQPNCSWMKMVPRTIVMPRNLRAETLPTHDYDRLSVAYGLSFLEIGKIIKSKPQMKPDVEHITDWQKNYIDKDQM